MKSFDRIKVIHGKPYLYRITPYYDSDVKEIRQRSTYIGPMRDGKVVQKTAVTYTYGDLLPVMKVVRDLNLAGILERILGENYKTVLVMAINHVIRPEAMNNIQEWYEDSYISRIYVSDLGSSSLSRIMESIGSINANHSFLREILNVTGKDGALYYDLTSFSSHSREIEFLEYGYPRSDPDYPQVNVSLVESSDEVPIFYDIYPGSVVDVTTVENTVEILKSTGLKYILLIMDRGMFSSSNIEYLMDSGIEFIMPASFTMKDVKRLALHSRRTIESGKNMIRISGDIIFAERHVLNISERRVNAWVFYDPVRDRNERSSFYSALYDRIERMRKRSVRKWEKPSDIVEEIMGPYRNFIFWKYNGSFIVRIKENAVSQRINRSGIVIIAFTGDHDASHVLMEYRKRDSVEKLFLASKSFIGAEPLRVHSMETLRGLMFVNLIALVIRSRMMREMRISGLQDKYSVEKMLLELHKMRKVILQDNREITTEITRKQKGILEAFSIKLEHVPTFLKS